MTSWFIADTHFGHAGIIEFCQRPFSNADEMDRYMIDSWNAVVQPKDIVYHLGDVGFSNEEKLAKILNKLRGHIYLVAGNHDQICKKPKVLARFMNRDALQRNFSNNGWAIHRQKVDDYRVTMCHYPILSPPKCDIHLHGHVHGRKLHFQTGEPHQPAYYDVGVDATGLFRPVTLEELRDLRLKGQL